MDPSLSRRLEDVVRGPCDAYSLSPNGNLLFCDGCLFDASESVVLTGVSAAAFSPCGRWVAVCRSELCICSVSALLRGEFEPRSKRAVGLCTELSFSSLGDLIFIEESSLFVATVGCDGSLTEILIASDVSNDLRILSNRIYTGNKIFSLTGDSLGTSACVGHITEVLTAEVRWGMTSLLTLKGERVADIDIVYPRLEGLFKHLFLRPSVLAVYIKLVDERITWSDKGISLPTVDAKTFTFWWEPIAKLLPVMERGSYMFEYTKNVIAPGLLYCFTDKKTLSLLHCLADAHAALWDGYERVMHASTAASALRGSVLLALSFLRTAPLETIEVDGSAINELQFADRELLRHFVPDACDHVNSVLDLVCAASDKPSDPWCEEEAVNHALSQCGKPAAHAQRAALRLGVELRDGLLVPRFRKLATHTRLDGVYTSSERVDRLVRSGEISLVSREGDLVFTSGGIWSALNGAMLAECDSASVSPCGTWIVSSDMSKLLVFNVSALRSGSSEPCFSVELSYDWEAAFSDNTVYLVSDKKLLSGDISPDGSIAFKAIAEPVHGYLYVVDNEVCVTATVNYHGRRATVTRRYSLSGEIVGHCIGWRVTRGATLHSEGGRPVIRGSEHAVIDVAFDALLYCLTRARFLRPSVLADYIKLIDERITWSDQGISLPTVDGGTFTFWWEPIAKLLPSHTERTSVSLAQMTIK